MRRRALATWAVAVTALPLLAGDCGGGDGGGGSTPRVKLESPDPLCVPLTDIGGFPPDFDFVPPPGGGAPSRVLAATASFSALIPIRVDVVPFTMPAGTATLQLPPDADGDGAPDLFKSIDGVHGLAADLSLVTVSGALEALLFVDPGGAAMAPVRVEIPSGLDPTDFAPTAGLPAPGQGRDQTGIATAVCVEPRPGAVDSRGEPIATAVPAFAFCKGPGIPSYPASFTAGAAVIADRVFVPLSNLGEGQGREDTQFLPGAVTVFELDRSVSPPVVSPSVATPDGRPYVLSSDGSFNASEATPYVTPSGRELVLVTHTGAIGILADDPATGELESGSISLTPGAIDVIDANSLVLLATIPLEGANPALTRLAIDPSGRLALLGEVGAKRLYLVDLAPLDALPVAPGQPWVLDGSDGPNSVVRDGRNPLEIPPLPRGAPPLRCPGRVEGVGFASSGERAFALETCDASLTVLSVDLSGNPSLAELRDRVAVEQVVPVLEPLRDDTLGALRQPTGLQVRPGVPDVDFTGPELLFLASDPESFLCGIDLDAL